MDQETLFRKDSMERISSPEQLNDYLRVTNPTVWVVMGAIILLLVGLFIWGSFAHIESYASGTAEVSGGKMVMYFDDERLAEKVEAGMLIEIGNVPTQITSVGRTADGRIFASARTSMAKGSYPARVVYRQTQVLSLLFR